MSAAASASATTREYETIYVLRPDVARESAARVAGRVEEAIGREGGRLTLVETWGRRQLAYPVRKLRRGVYVYVKYVGGGKAVNELERNLRMLDDVLKFQTVLVRGDVDAATLSVDPEAVKFEAIEAPAEPEPEDTIERRLGLVEMDPDRRRDPGIDAEEVMEAAADAGAGAAAEEES
ncbi:MAG: 30S ribosomal protein S6 [Polyangiaceae bacterium]|nr:30S ribosomal protein S6 [Polyangiaceae bacterium]